MAFLFLVSAGAFAVEDGTTGPPEPPPGHDIVFSDDFGDKTANDGWDLYGSGGSIARQDGVLQLTMDIEPGGNGQTGPRYTIPLDVSQSWAGREITISWKVYSETDCGVRLNLAPGPNLQENGERNIYGASGVTDNCPANQWNSYTASCTVEGDMTSGDFQLFFKVNGAVKTVAFDDVTVSVSAASPTISTEVLDEGIQNTPYHMELRAGGSQPMTWRVSEGSLPQGLELQSGGILTGTPTGLGDTAFTLEVSNQLGSDTKEFQISILEADNMFTLSETTGKGIGMSNALITQRFGADPWAMEYNGRLYVYMTNDHYEYDGEGNILDNSYSKIKHINVISSADLVNWTDHGSIPVAGSQGVAKWAGNSWAPCAVWRNEDGVDRFYLYFTNGGGGVGVLTSDSPVGPWNDPNGKALVSHATENCSGKVVPWCFDPAVYIDDDGSAYLYFGGGIPNDENGNPIYDNPRSGRVVRLKDNLTEIDGVPEEIAPLFFFEASAVHKYNGKYYFTYSANFGDRKGAEPGAPASGSIAYLMGDSPMGPFTYTGEVFAGPGAFGFGGGNNHQCVFQFKGEWYLAYHGSIVSMAKTGKTGYRSTHIDKLAYNDDGTIVKVTGTREGVPQLETFDPYTKIEAETMAWNGGIETMMVDDLQWSTNNLLVTGIESGDWLGISGADLGDKSPKSLIVNAAGQFGGTIELRTGSPDPDSRYTRLLATLTIPNGNGVTTDSYSAPITEEITGVENLFLVFKGQANNVELFNLDWWQLSAEEGTDAQPTPAAETAAPSSPTAAPETTTPPAGDDGEGGMPGWFWAGLSLVGAAAICVSSLFFIKKKKKNQHRKGS